MTNKDARTILVSMHDILAVTREHKFKDPNGRNALDYHSSLYRARQLIAEMVMILDRENERNA